MFVQHWTDMGLKLADDNTIPITVWIKKFWQKIAREIFSILRVLLFMGPILRFVNTGGLGVSKSIANLQSMRTFNSHTDLARDNSNQWLIIGSKRNGKSFLKGTGAVWCENYDLLIPFSILRFIKF
jgi:hypothetical protein